MQRRAAAARRRKVVQQQGPEGSPDEAEDGHAEATAAREAGGASAATTPVAAQLETAAAQGGSAEDVAGSPEEGGSEAGGAQLLGQREGHRMDPLDMAEDDEVTGVPCWPVLDSWFAHCIRARHSGGYQFSSVQTPSCIHVVSCRSRRGSTERKRWPGTCSSACARSWPCRPLCTSMHGFSKVLHSAWV